MDTTPGPHCTVTLTAEYDLVWLTCDVHGRLRNLGAPAVGEAADAEHLHTMVAGNAARLAVLNGAGGGA